MDVLVVYTPAARTGAGGTSQMLAAINQAVAQTNLAYANSGVTTRLRLVHVAEVTYTESGNHETDIARLQSPNDGYMDNVHTLRNTYGADLVSLIVQTGQYCGIGYFLAPPWQPGYSEWAFRLVRRDCLANYTLAHELGHNMGATHDWFVSTGTVPYTYCHGYVDRVRNWRTIMAYWDECDVCASRYCATIPHFSNPNVNYGGYPTGVAGGTSTSCTLRNCSNPRCDADVARTFNNTAYTVANFRQATVPGPANDNFANAQVISGSFGGVSGTNVAATKESGEPNHAGEPGGASVWYRWTAPSSGTYTMGTAGSDFDTLLAVYTGTAVNSLTPIASNDDFGGLLTSLVNFTATAGTTYRIAVDGYGAAMGEIRLGWAPNTGAVFRVDRETGSVFTDGRYYGTQYLAGSADIAEWVSVSEAVEAGDVLEIDPTRPGYYRKARGPSCLVAGVVSTQPGVVLGGDGRGEGGANQALLALLGIVPVKVTNEGGPIRPGDLLVASSTPGYARRWDPKEGAPCSFVGKALEPCESRTGVIQVLLMR